MVYFYQTGSDYSVLLQSCGKVAVASLKCPNAILSSLEGAICSRQVSQPTRLHSGKLKGFPVFHTEYAFGLKCIIIRQVSILLEALIFIQSQGKCVL